MDCGPFFFCTRAIRMDLDDGAVEGQRLHAYADDLFFLQRGEHSIQHASLRPTVHARVNGMPATESLWKATPLTAMLGHVQDRVQHVQVRDCDVPPLLRKAAFDASILLFGDYHAS
jgi:hypothetical protein